MAITGAASGAHVVLLALRVIPGAAVWPLFAGMDS
jgi:hypothetical protein